MGEVLPFRKKVPGEEKPTGGQKVEKDGDKNRVNVSDPEEVKKSMASAEAAARRMIDEQKELDKKTPKELAEEEIKWPWQRE